MNIVLVVVHVYNGVSIVVGVFNNVTLALVAIEDVKKLAWDEITVTSFDMNQPGKISSTTYKNSK